MSPYSGVLFILASTISLIKSETVPCNGNCNCLSPSSVPLGTTCTLDCGGIDRCKQDTLTCREGDPCIILCTGKSSCAAGTRINAHQSTHVKIICGEDDACKDKIDINCGTGHCQLECYGSTACESFGNIDVSLSDSFICIGNCPNNIPASFSASPTLTPTITSSSPTHTPTNPTISPTQTPTNPTNIPTDSPTPSPTYNPTLSPTPSPTINPTNTPTFSPTITPSISPTSPPSNTPSYSPTNTPSNTPTYSPSIAPTNTPTISPTNNPTQPTNIPTNNPTYIPTFDPTNDPTSDPTNDPTNDPTTDPTINPTNIPTINPTANPTSATFVPSSMRIPTVLTTTIPTSFMHTTDMPTATPIKQGNVNAIYTTDISNEYTLNKNELTTNDNKQSKILIYIILTIGLILCCCLCLCVPKKYNKNKNKNYTNKEQKHMEIEIDVTNTTYAQNIQASTPTENVHGTFQLNLTNVVGVNDVLMNGIFDEMNGVMIVTSDGPIENNETNNGKFAKKSAPMANNPDDERLSDDEVLNGVNTFHRKNVYGVNEKGTHGRDSNVEYDEQYIDPMLNSHT